MRFIAGMLVWFAVTFTLTLTLVTVGVLLLLARLRRRREARVRVLPPPVPVVSFRPGARLSPEDVDDLEEQLRAQRMLRRALHGRRCPPIPQLMA